MDERIKEHSSRRIWTNVKIFEEKVVDFLNKNELTDP